MEFKYLVSLSILFCFTRVVPLQATKVTHIALIGATGDLAKKYLWQGLFNLFQEKHADDNVFKIFGGARVETAKGQLLLKQILEERVKCEDCADAKAKFQNLVVYHQLKRESDYEKFCSMINASSHSVCSGSDLSQGVCYQDSDLEEAGRLFYLSIPPFAYAETSRFIHKHCRPSSSKTWLRVVLEKPFGSDLSSAAKLAKDLRSSLKEEEMYRIDHYLGKTVSMEILKFRKDNEDILGHIWDSHGIDKVEIVMSETVDVQGRALFYDEYGVIRDVMQNHLTELLVLLAMDLPHDLNDVQDVHQKKLELLRQLKVISPRSVLVGQYKDYASHVREDYEDKEKKSNKPTFAAALAHVLNNRWHGVNFHLISGKKLRQRASYVKVTFKNRHSCLVESKSCDTEPSVLIFNIGHGDIGAPAIALTKSLGIPKSDWPMKNVENRLIFGRKSEEFSILSPPKDSDAYSSLIRGVFNGDQDLFVSTEGLMLSWEKWTPTVQHFDDIEPKIYEGGANIDAINYMTKGIELHYLQNGRSVDSISAVSLGTFREAPLILGNTLPLIEKLASDILQNAQDAIVARGVFHLALSGGTTPLKLFPGIFDLGHRFPWRHTHIWMTDERCVPSDDARSNFGQMAKNLLKFIEIPYTNIHPMPVHLTHGICFSGDRGDEMYASSIKYLVENAQLDFTVLGVGGDGHTASLFPKADSLLETEKTVTYSDGGPPEISSKRMTLTFPALNKSRKVAIVLLGKGKADLVGTLKTGVTDVHSYPITGVSPEKGALSWYIDFDAFNNS